jgi:hypothetical protein
MTDLKLARVARGFDGVEARDQLLVKVAAFGQRPATDAVEDLTAESQTGVKPTGGVLLCQTLELTARWSLSADHRPSVFTSRIETCRI